jgi:hypothetical protein
MIDVENLQLGNRISQGQIAQVHRYDLDCLGDDPRAQFPQVVPLEVDDPRIDSEAADQLAQTGLHGIDAAGAECQEGGREAPCARSHIKRHSRGNGDREVTQGLGKLEIAAQAPRRQDFQGCIGPHAGCGI